MVCFVGRHRRADKCIAPDVGVIQVTTGPHAVTVEAFGSAKSRYQMTLTAQVSGQVSELAIAFESGRIVNKGDRLLTLEDSDYRAALASAKHDLASARVDLLEAEREAEQAGANPCEGPLRRADRQSHRLAGQLSAGRERHRRTLQCRPD